MTIEDFKAALPEGGVLCGIDLGRKTIGLAFSDADWRFCGPDTVIRRTREVADLAALKRQVEARAAKGLVLGLPLNMDGTPGPAAQRSRAFARTLERDLPLPLLLWDERLTSEAATEEMAEAGIPRAKWPEKIDAFAAAIILRGVIERLACA